MSERFTSHTPIAIVGMSCRFPGAANTDAFWEMLCNAGTGVCEVPEERWNAARFFHPEPKTPGKISGRWGGFLDGLDRFDAAFFGIPPREAPHVDPRQRQILEVAWEALDDAGIPPLSLAGSATGVYIATLSNDYDVMLCRNYRKFTASTGSGTANSIIANRISYFLDLHGPSLTLDTACSGSLIAIELACRSLKNGESALALAGGISINLLPKGDVFFSSAGALSPTGSCKTFDARADGIVRGEGAAVIVLKRLDDALAAGDRIYALIRGGAINHDGASNGIMAPNGEAQKRVLDQAYRNAGVNPADVHYVEAHGTGTPLGDPIEVSALAEVMAGDRGGAPLILGSLKPNTGHMEAAAGVASVMKVALAMRNNVIPPNREFTEWNPWIARPDFPLEVLKTPSEWRRNGKPRVAGVSAFSFGGSNAHLVLEEAPPAVAAPTAETKLAAFVLPVSAKSPEALRDSLGAFQRFVEGGSGGASLNDLCYTAAVKRSHHHHRFAATGADARELAERLTAGAASPKPVTKLAFVFSGQGSQCRGMGAGLRESEPVFRDAMEACDRLFSERTGWSVIQEIDSGERLDQTDISQAAVFSMQVALAALWTSWGIQPDAVVGQSLGEVAAAHIAGALSLGDAVEVVHQRARLMKRVAGSGKTAVVGLAADAAREAIAPWSRELCVAGMSSPATSVVSGAPVAVDAMVSALEQRGVFARAIPGVDVAFHGPQMAPLRADLEAALRGVASRTARTGMMSTVTAEWLNGSGPDAGYWGRNLCEPFRFAGAVGRLLDEGFDGFLEISPSALLVGAIRQALGAKNAEALVLGSGSTPMAAYQSLGALYTAGREVNWASVFGSGGRTVSLPAYPWQRERYWLDQIPGGPANIDEAPTGHPLLGKRTESALPGAQCFWDQAIDLSSLHYLAGHKVLGSVIYPGAAFVESALAGVGELHEGDIAELRDIRFIETMRLSAESPRHVQLAFTPSGTGSYQFQFSARETGGLWKRHAAGTAAHMPAGDAPRLAIDELRTRYTEHIEGAAHYAAMLAQGMEFGPEFRTIRHIWRSGPEALAELELDPAAGAREYALHPILIDGAMQVVAATVEPGEGGLYSSESYLPEGIGRVRYYANPGRRAMCVARLRSGSPGMPRMHADVQVFDEAGAMCLEIDDLRLALVAEGKAGARGTLRDWLYELAWDEAPLAPSETSNVRQWTIVADPGTLAQELAETLRARGGTCNVVAPESLEVEPSFAEAGRGVVYLGGIAGGENPCDLPLRIVKAMALSGQHNTPGLWLVTRRTQVVDDLPPVLSPAAQLWGFGNVVALEHPELRCHMIDLADDGDVTKLVDELLSGGDDARVAFRGGKRYAARLRPAKMKAKSDPVVFRPDAAYWITGGLGGLGVAVARWMTERGARRFILSGRTPIPPRAQWDALPDADPAKGKVAAIRELERLGATVHTPVLDSASSKEVCAFVEQFHREGWPRIRGVIHAAGVVEDQLMLRLDAASFARVLRPKVTGACALHEATEQLDLDFFTLFSSVSSVLGQFGQAHYAAGNAFLDHLAHWRRAQGLPANTINWGPWAEVGLYAQMDTAGKASRSGVFPMLPDQALEAMEYIQATNPAQMVVVSADWSRMPATPLLAGLAPASRSGASSSEDAQAAAALMLELLLVEPQECKRRIEESLRDAAAKVLGLDPARLDTKEPLTSYGMDSIMVVELRAHIEKTMNLNISMVDLFTGSISKLAEQLAEKLADTTHLEELLGQVEGMSPDEIESLLDRNEEDAKGL